MWGGSIKQGDLVELLPAGRQARARSLQVHGEKREEAFAGERVAVNLTGVERDLVERGSWLTSPGALQENRRVDIRLSLLPDAPEISQRIRVHVHHGTTEVLARVKLLGTTSLKPGGSCFAQLELESPLTALPGDRVILRFYSPMFTIGGGIILDPAAARHKRRQLSDGINRLEALHSGNKDQILLATMYKDGKPWQLPDAASALQVSKEQAQEVTSKLAQEGKLLELADGYYFPCDSFSALAGKLSAWLSDYSKKWPMRFGAPKKEALQILMPRMDPKQQRVILAQLESHGSFTHDELTISLSGWQPVLTADQQRMVQAIDGLYSKTPLTPPTWTEVVSLLNIPSKEQGEYLQWLHRSGKLIRVADDLHYTPQALRETENILRTQVPNGYTLGEARDLLGVSRKYAHKVCEYFDLVKLTYWDGEKHFWRG